MPDTPDVAHVTPYPARIVLVDDHGLVREGLKLLLTTVLGLEVVGETGDGAEVERLVRALAPDLLVLDLELPGCHGIEVAARIKRQESAPKILVVTGRPESDMLNRAVDAGVEGFLVKHGDGDEFLLAVQTVLNGGVYIGKRVADGVRQDASPTITQREQEIVRRIATGQSSPEIASALNISPHTVRTHRKTLMGKLGLRNSAEVVAYAMRQGLFTPN